MNTRVNDRPKRETLTVPKCEYGVPSQSIYQPGITDCGEPAVTKWIWPNGSMFTCAEHDEMVEEWE